MTMHTKAKPTKNTLPDVERQVEIACKRISQRAVVYLEKLIERAIEGSDIDPNVVLKAVNEVLNRGLGKPRQQVDQNININSSDAIVEAINASKQRLLKKVEDTVDSKLKLN